MTPREERAGGGACNQCGLEIELCAFCERVLPRADLLSLSADRYSPGGPSTSRSRGITGRSQTDEDDAEHDRHDARAAPGVVRAQMPARRASN